MALDTFAGDWGGFFRICDDCAGVESTLTSAATSSQIVLNCVLTFKPEWAAWSSMIVPPTPQGWQNQTHVSPSSLAVKEGLLS
jgi:hypothetical protein